MMSEFFNSNSPLRKKILLPFIVLVSVMAISSILISTYFLSDTLNKNAIKELERESRISETFFKQIQQELQVLSRFAYTLKRSDASSFSQFLSSSTDQTALFNALSLTTKEDIPENQKAIFYPLLEDAKTGKIVIQPILLPEDNPKRMEWVCVSTVYINREEKTVILRLPINQMVLNHIPLNPKTYFAAFHLNKSSKAPMLLAADPLILESKTLQATLKRYVNRQNYDTLGRYQSSFQLNNVRYLLWVQKDFFHPDVVAVVLKTYDEAFMAKLKIIGSHILLWLLIGGCLFWIYALMIGQITSSLEVLSSVSKRVAKGDLSQGVYLKSKDEVGELATIFNQMIKGLKESSQNLLREKERSEAIISCIPQGVIVTDYENRLMFSNHQAELMFNFSLDQAQGKILLDYLQNEDVIRAFSEKFGDQEQPITRDIVISDPYGKNRNYALTSSLLRDKNNDHLGVVTVLRDQTYEKEVEELREGFLRTVSHELRTPLTSVIGFIELVYSGALGPLTQDQKTPLKTALDEAITLKSLINDLLDLSQIQAGKSKLQLTTLHAQEFLTHIVKTMTPLATAKQLSLKVNIQEEPLKFRADSLKLKRVLLNLLSNAIKFTNEGHVLLEFTDVGHDIVIKVSDTGIGIKPEDQGIIFEKFRQVDYSSTRDYEGIGLGLSIVKQLVEMHQGKIWVESEYSKGSTFILMIPKQFPK